MAVNINADTVVGGAVVTADASGQLALQGAGVTQLTVTNSGVTLVNPLSAGSGGTGNAFFSVSGPATSTKTYTFPNESMSVGYRNIPAVGTQTGSYTLAVGDVGKYVQVSTGGSITIPTGVFSEGDAILIANNTTGNITITCSAPTAYIVGTNTVKTSMALATRGVANVFFLSGSVCFVSGNVS
jgi:hypothetical protein